MKNYRIDIFPSERSIEITTPITRYFDDVKSAERAGHEAYRDGASMVFLLTLIECIGKYEVTKQL